LTKTLRYSKACLIQESMVKIMHILFQFNHTPLPSTGLEETTWMFLDKDNPKRP